MAKGGEVSLEKEDCFVRSPPRPKKMETKIHQSRFSDEEEEEKGGGK